MASPMVDILYSTQGSDANQKTLRRTFYVMG